MTKKISVSEPMKALAKSIFDSELHDFFRDGRWYERDVNFTEEDTLFIKWLNRRSISEYTYILCGIHKYFNEKDTKILEDIRKAKYRGDLANPYFRDDIYFQYVLNYTDNLTNYNKICYLRDKIKSEYKCLIFVENADKYPIHKENNISFNNMEFRIMKRYGNGWSVPYILILNELEQKANYLEEEIKCKNYVPNNKVEDNPLANGLDTPRAEKYFDRAINYGYMQKTTNGYKWIFGGTRGAKARLAYFLERVYCPNPTDKIRSEEIRKLECLFDVKRLDRSLQETASSGKTEYVKQWKNEIDTKIFFEEAP